MFESLFYSGITVLAALIIAILFSVFIFFFSGVFAKTFLPINAFPGTIEIGFFTLIGKSIIQFIVGTAVLCVLSKFILVGFSEDLNRQIRWLDYRGDPTSEAVNFVFIIGAPCFVHYVMCLIGTYGRRKIEE